METDISIGAAALIVSAAEYSFYIDQGAKSAIGTRAVADGGQWVFEEARDDVSHNIPNKIAASGVGASKHGVC